MFQWFYSLVERHIDSPYATPILAILFFLEAIIFIPVDPLLIVYCIHKQSRALWYATVATCASVLGGIAGYYIGYAIWESFGQWFVNMVIGQDTFKVVLDYFAKYEMWAVLIAGFTPIPYKAVTLGAGFCKLPLLPFIACSFIARGARFYLIGGLITVWGAKIKEYIDRYFNLLVLLFVLLIILGVVLVRA